MYVNLLLIFFSIKFVTISEVMHMNECADGTEAVSLICRL